MASAGLVVDNFNDNFTNLCLWEVSITGSGTSVQEINGRVEVTLAADGADDPSLGVFGAGYLSEFTLQGDFDIQVDFDLPVFPFASGARVALTVTNFAVERTSFGSAADFPGQPREVYLNDVSGSVQDIVATDDTTGKLRLVREGSTGHGYYWSDDVLDWVLIGSGSITEDAVVSAIASWSHDFRFTDQAVKVAFDNYQLNAGVLVPNPECAVPEVSSFLLCSLMAGGCVAAVVVRRVRRARAISPE
jgi:hypothetical protein